MGTTEISNFSTGSNFKAHRTNVQTSYLVHKAQSSVFVLVGRPFAEQIQDSPISLAFSSRDLRFRSVSLCFAQFGPGYVQPDEKVLLFRPVLNGFVSI